MEEIVVGVVLGIWENQFGKWGGFLGRGRRLLLSTWSLEEKSVGGSSSRQVGNAAVAPEASLPGWAGPSVIQQLPEEQGCAARLAGLRAGSNGGEQ